MLLLSRNASYGSRGYCIVGYVTRTIRGIRSEVGLTPEDGMPAACVVNLDNMNTVPESLLERRITVLGPQRMAEVEHAIHFALALSS